MRSTPQPIRSPRTSTRTLASGQVAIVALVVTFLVLMIGIWAGFAGRPWGRYVAYAAFAALCLLAALSEHAGWRRVVRSRRHVRRLDVPRPATHPPRAPPPAVGTSYRERLRSRPVDFLEQAGSWFLGLVVVVVLLGGTVWVIGFLLSR